MHLNAKAYFNKKVECMTQRLHHLFTVSLQVFLTSKEFSELRSSVMTFRIKYRISVLLSFSEFCPVIRLV